jgi:fructose-specific phosphotransferase system component IIB
MEDPRNLKRMRDEDEETEPRDSLFDDNVDYDEEDDDEEEVALSEQESGMMENFISKVKRMCQLEDEIKEINASKKSLTDEKNDLRKEIITFMAAKDVGKVNYGEDEVLYIETRESSGSLNRKSLLNAIKSYYEVNDIQVSEEEVANLESATQNRLHDAQDLYDYVNEFLGKETKVVLVREAKNKKKRARKQNSLSVFN